MKDKRKGKKDWQGDESKGERGKGGRKMRMREMKDEGSIRGRKELEGRRGKEKMNEEKMR